MAKIIQIVMINQDDQTYAGQFLTLDSDGKLALLDVGEQGGEPRYTLTPVELAS